MPVWCKYSSGTQMTVLRAFLEWPESLLSEQGLIAKFYGARRARMAVFRRCRHEKPTIAFPAAHRRLFRQWAVSFSATAVKCGTCADSPLAGIPPRRRHERPFRAPPWPGFRRLSPFEKTAGFSPKSPFSASNAPNSPLFS